MKFNDLQVGMYIGTILRKHTNENTNYILQEILSLSDTYARVLTIGYFENGGKFYRGSKLYYSSISAKSVGLSEPVNDLNQEDKRNFILAIFSAETI